MPHPGARSVWRVATRRQPAYRAAQRRDRRRST